MGYRKVPYNRLAYQQAELCLKELLEQVFRACETLSKKSIRHCDVRLPNICFKDYEVVLIDFDKAEHIPNSDSTFDLSTFVLDLREKYLKTHWIQTDKFLSELCEGIKWNDESFKKSTVYECTKSIKNVIEEFNT